MSKNFYIAQIIAIGQSQISASAGLTLQPRGIDLLAQKMSGAIDEKTPHIQQLIGIVGLLASLKTQSWFSVGTPVQRMKWCAYWEDAYTQMVHYQDLYSKVKTTLSFKEWLSRQTVPEWLWSFVSFSSLAMEQAIPATVSEPKDPFADMVPQNKDIRAEIDLSDYLMSLPKIVVIVPQQRKSPATEIAHIIRMLAKNYQNAC